MDIIIVGWAIFIILLILFLLKLLYIVSRVSEIVDDLHDTYFKFHYLVALPFKYLTNILNFFNRKKWA